jgi:hypothetical protein
MVFRYIGNIPAMLLGERDRAGAKGGKEVTDDR